MCLHIYIIVINIYRWYKGYSLGFRHMIRFVAIKMFQHPALKDFEYYWRLDSDSFLVREREP